MGDGNFAMATQAGKKYIGKLELEASYVPQFRISLISERNTKGQQNISKKKGKEERLRANWNYTLALPTDLDAFSS